VGPTQEALAQVKMKGGPTHEVLMQEENDAVLIQDVTTQAETAVIDVLQGADSAYADVAEAQPSDAAAGTTAAPVSPGGACLDLVVCSPGPSLPGNTVSRDVVPAPGSLGAADPGVNKVGLPGYLGTSSPHVN
jgi:hypothetical protein